MSILGRAAMGSCESLPKTWRYEGIVIAVLVLALVGAVTVYLADSP